MVYPKFDENKYKKTFDNMFGKGAFNSGIAQAREVGRTTAQVKIEQDNYTQRLRDAQKAAKEAEKAAKKKTYNDALAYWNDPKNKTKLKQQGADRNANDILNDPNLQSQIKSQGYKVDDYVNALYNAASDGKFRSAREYKQYVGGLNKEVAAKKKDGNSTDSLISKYTDGNKQNTSVASKNTNKSSDGGGLSGLFNKLKNSEVGRAIGSAEQFFNPFDNVKAGDAVKNYLNHKPSKTAQEVQRGANRAVDSASLGLMSNLDKKINKRDPYYNSQRKMGEGGGTDMITSGLGYLVPGLGGAKAVKGLGLGVKAGSTGLAKLGQLAREGAIAGGGIGAAEVGIREALNPQDNNWQQNLGHVSLGTALGGVGDLALGGAGMALKGASQNAMKRMLPSNNSLSKSFADVLGPNPERLGLPAPRLGLPEPIMTRPRTSGPVNVQGTPLLTGPTQPKPVVQAYDKEFNNAVEQQFQYLKNSMGKGTTPGGLIKDREGYVTGAFGRVSNNPKWYQDFYAANKRKPNNQELRDLAVQHVKQGFTDEGGQIPPWKPKAVQEIDNQISQAMSYIKQDPTQEPAIRPILNALQKDRSNAAKPYDWLNGESNVVKSATRADQLRAQADQLEAQAQAIRDTNGQNIVAGQPIQKGQDYTQKFIANESKRQNLLKQADDLRNQASASENFQAKKSKNSELTALEKKISKTEKDLKRAQSQLHDATSGKFPSLEPFINDLKKEVPKLQKRLAKLAKENETIAKQEPIPNVEVMKKAEEPTPIQETPLNFRKEQIAKKVPLSYVGKMSPQDMVAQRSIRTTPPDSPMGPLRPGRDYEPITANGSINADPGIVPKPVNHDIPYNPGDTLPDTTGHIGTKTKKDLPSLGALKDKTYIQTVDNVYTLDKFDKAVENVTGVKLNPSESSYTLALNSRNADQISHQILTNAMVNKNGEVVGPSLKSVISEVPSNKYNEFLDYLINRHAIDRQTRGEKVFPSDLQMNAKKSAAKVTEYEQKYPYFKKVADKNNEFNKKLTKTWVVDEGIITKKQWETYQKNNPNYVPNNRIFKDIEKGRFGNQAKKGFSNQSKPIKKVSPTGSERPIVDPIESQIEHATQYVKTAKRNEVMKTVIANIQKDPEAFKGIAEIVPTKDTPNEIMDILNKDGISGLLDGFNNKFIQKPDLTNGNVVFGLIDGKKVHVKIHDPQLLDALTNLQPQAQHIIVKSMGQITRVMKNLTTGINPVFSLTRNVWRDIPTAYANSKTLPRILGINDPAKFTYDLLDSFTSVMSHPVAQSKILANKTPSLSRIANNRADLYQQFLNVGGGHSSPQSGDINLLAQSKRSIVPRQKGLLNGAKHYGGKLLGGLENLNNAIESAPRLAEFKRLNGNTYDAKMKALYEANDVTVNFNKHGNFTKGLDAFVPYVNAAVQGLDKTYRTFKDQPLRTAINGFTAITIPSIILYVVNHNNPDYQKLSNYIKDNNFLIPNGDGTFTKIPKSRELGPMFGSDVERALRLWNEQDPEAFKGFGKTVLENFMPPTRTILHPALVDTVANKNFAGVPIVPGDLQNLSPKYQYDSKTSEVAKGIGNIFNVSPKKVDYLAKSYGGIVAELGIPATTKDATIGDTLKQKVTADPVFSNDLMTKFYDEKTKLDQAHNDLVKQGAVSGDLNEERRKVMNTAATNIGKIRKAIKATQVDQTLTPKDRLARIRSLQQVINNIADSTLQ